MLLLAGLGNPGRSYAGHRHNVGFMAADAIHRRHGFSGWSKKYQADVSEGRIGDEKALLLKPQTFMNLSGQSVAAAAKFFRIEPKDIVVFYDELDLAPGKLRVTTGGGAGGHNGIRSIDGHLGKEYRRVRIGIGHPGVKELVTGHVLGDFSKADREWLDPLLDAIADNVEILARGDDAGFMNKISLATRGESAPSPTPASKDGSPAGRQQSHIRQARPAAPKATLPTTGPMAAMLKKLFGGDK